LLSVLPPLNKLRKERGQQREGSKISVEVSFKLNPSRKKDKKLDFNSVNLFCDFNPMSFDGSMTSLKLGGRRQGGKNSSQASLLASPEGQLMASRPMPPRKLHP
jgi:hypothetical protein